jgi:hypothetical protein
MSKSNRYSHQKESFLGNLVFPRTVMAFSSWPLACWGFRENLCNQWQENS